MRQLIRALFAVLVLFVIALVSALITMRLAIHGAEVRVPALAGLTVEQAVAQTRARGLESAIDGRFYSSTQPAGRVLTQSPAPKTQVRKSWRVRITVSLGPQKVAIPALEGMDKEIATITIRRLGLQVGDLAALPDEYAPQNTIVAQTPSPHATDVQSPRVALLVALPSSPQQEASVMPDLTGETFSMAALTVLHAGFKLAPLRSPPTNAAANSTATTPSPSAASAPAPSSPVQHSPPAQSSVAPGTVIAQNPPAGSRIVAGSTVDLTVQP